MHWLFISLALVAFAAKHPGAGFLILSLSIIYELRKPGNRADLLGGLIGSILLSFALWAVGSF